MRAPSCLRIALFFTAFVTACATTDTSDSDPLARRRRDTGKGSVQLGMGQDAALAMGVKRHGRTLFRRHVFSAELFGRGGPYSFNYDYAIAREVSTGIGFSLFPQNGHAVATFPLYLNYYPVGIFHRLLLTGGATLVFGGGEWHSQLFRDNGVGFPFGVGYEYRGRQGFLFRAVPYFYVGDVRGVWGGLSFGFAY